MLVGIGCDVCAISRFEEMVNRRPGAADRVLTEAERKLPIRSQAARFAAKEALAKALGVPDGLRWHDCQIVQDERGKPDFEFSGTVKAALVKAGITKVHLSLSHDGDLALAFVVCEE